MTSLRLANPYDRHVVALFGLPFDQGGMSAVVDKVDEAAATDTRLWLSTVNLDWAYMARRDYEFRASILRSDLVTCDGAPIFKLSALTGVPLQEKVTGADLFETLRSQTAGRPLKTYFFGGRDNSADMAHARLQRDTTRLEAGGAVNPGFGDIAALSTPALISGINEANADLLVVSLGARKGQEWIARNRRHLNVPVVTHLGAVVDFVAGNIKRAPKSAQRLNLEWAWRIGQDRALWKRYAKDAGFLPQLMSEAIKTRRVRQSLAKTVTKPATIAYANGVLDVDGVVHDAALSDLRKVLSAADADPHGLLIRLSDQAFVDLDGLGLFLIAYQRYLDRNLPFAITSSNAAMRALLHVNHLPLSSGLRSTTTNATDDQLTTGASA